MPAAISLRMVLVHSKRYLIGVTHMKDLSRRMFVQRSAGICALSASTIGHIALSEIPLNTVDAMFNVRTYGATGDGKTVDTPAINKAIEAVAAAGGGMLLFPSGTYICFTIRLRSKVDLYLSHGCTIEAADSPRPGETTGYQGGYV